MKKLFLLLFGMISLSCKYFLKTWWWPSRNQESLFQIFLIHCNKSLLALEVMSIHCREWSTCPQNTSGYHLHEVNTGDKGISGNSCQNTNICSTPTQGGVSQCVSRIVDRRIQIVFEIFEDKSGFEDIGKLWQYRWNWQVRKKAELIWLKYLSTLSVQLFFLKTVTL